MDGKKRFRKLQGEQNSKNEKMNVSKLEETRQNATTTTKERNQTALLLH